ncbi:LOW QUALITY PROTEIN: protein-L-isoaspartate(D-aspartate) O-methyltransferase-like [Heliangelus exortis]|uniref:LOW QUALITY PROTEIN: protein-L-isoaspartate(D-aspartate) O-methyltransferase-like n=1 Tax=Heliangelus exortis TaxID=472823 RepID=UPI003A924F41
MTCLLPCTLLPLMGLLFARTMAWTSSGKTHPELINNLYKKGIIKSPASVRVLLATDRGHYIKYFPYMDSPQSIGYKATISAPHMHAHALELLKDQLVEGGKALDVGSGSGYLTACFARMMGPTGKLWAWSTSESWCRNPSGMSRRMIQPCSAPTCEARG